MTDQRYMIWPNFMRLSIPFSYPEYIFSVMQSHLSQSANDLICLLLINDMSFLKPVLGSLPTVFIYQVNCASFGAFQSKIFIYLFCPAFFICFSSCFFQLIFFLLIFLEKYLLLIIFYTQKFCHRLFLLSKSLL